MVGHKLRRLVQHARAAIVAETAPRGQHLLLSGQSEREQRGKRAMKSW